MILAPCDAFRHQPRALQRRSIASVEGRGDAARSYGILRSPGRHHLHASPLASLTEPRSGVSGIAAKNDQAISVAGEWVFCAGRSALQSLAPVAWLSLVVGDSDDVDGIIRHKKDQ